MCQCYLLSKVRERKLNTTIPSFKDLHIKPSFGKEAGIQCTNLRGQGESVQFFENLAKMCVFYTARQD